MPSTMGLGKYLRRLWILAALSVATTLIGAAAQSSPTIKTVFPAEIDEPLTNPYMGWGIWAGAYYYDGKPLTVEYNTTGFGDNAPLFSWVLIDWMWADLEPREGEYHWQDLDAVINYWEARGKQIELRVWITYDPGWNGAPGREVCPEWLWKAGARFREYVGEGKQEAVFIDEHGTPGVRYSEGKTKKREPDYADPSYERIYLPRVRRFLTALAERYDKPESPIALWGTMGYGKWGEWHSPYVWPSPEVKHNILAGIVTMYADIFKVKKLSIAYVQDSDISQVNSLEDFMYRQALDVAAAKGFAMEKHGFIDALFTWDKRLMEKYWRLLPMWAEGDWSYTDVKNDGWHGTLDENLELMLAWHSNYAHLYLDGESYKRAMREDRAYFERGLRSGGLGYRLVLTSASWHEELPTGNILVLRQTWLNRNVGHLYQRHPLKLYLTDSNGNEKLSEVDRSFDGTQWVKGDTYSEISVFELPGDLPPGVYDLRIALVDEKDGNPRIKLAIQGADSKGRYKLGTIRILKMS